MMRARAPIGPGRRARARGIVRRLLTWLFLCVLEMYSSDPSITMTRMLRAMITSLSFAVPLASYFEYTPPGRPAAAPPRGARPLATCALCFACALPANIRASRGRPRSAQSLRAHAQAGSSPPQPLTRRRDGPLLIASCSKVLKKGEEKQKK